MKKLLILLLLLVPKVTDAWESTIGVGAYARRFNEKDQLGALSKDEGLKPESSAGLALNGSFLCSVSPSLLFGPDLTITYSWLSAPQQDNLQTQSLIAAGNLQYNDNGFSLALKSGFILNSLTTEYDIKIDFDTGFITSVKVGSEVMDSARFYFEPQLIITPSIEAKNSFVNSFALVIGVENIFRPKKKVEVVKVVEAVVEPPKEITPVKLPEVITPVAAPPIIVLAPIVVEPPKEITPVKLPEPVTPVQPIEKPKPLALKFDGNNLSPESIGFLENVVKIHKSIASVIKVHHSRGKNAKKKSEVLYTWFINHGAKKEEVLVVPDLKGKEIKIEVVPK